MPVSGLSLERDQQRDDFGDDGNAFEQEQRQLHRTGDLRSRARLTANGLRRACGQAANAYAGADGGQTGADGSAQIRNRKDVAFQSLISFSLVR